ncbi:hypothetical protein [Brevibacillus laterosporus]|uniref:Uncharacterized protein n=1 Tax=Brevibacillus laterosporus TaxID=1465 RepID=A0AAP3DJS6_BRELA|nr:hypothetical protein [Brevibacillus laterosporus]MCR8982623.1 hypothetical protein [Brevibacillus laterosporus]MCZ0809779.1 hypothetical protein [Brevibacillus laterosporus]MCZ0828387.1 hypothetical protein [Brevibacillus laterosporus]MCZ0852397.1 hypothetical protein [Brevibacillus laterosporus]
MERNIRTVQMELNEQNRAIERLNTEIISMDEEMRALEEKINKIGRELAEMESTRSGLREELWRREDYVAALVREGKRHASIA